MFVFAQCIETKFFNYFFKTLHFISLILEVSMLKRTLAIFTLAVCGLTSLQAMDATSFSQEIEINQETEQQDELAACCGKRKHRRPHKKKRASLVVEETSACKKCKDKHFV
jgi:hypothetical protein